MKNNQKGFAAIEAILIIIILAIVGFTGWFVYHRKQATDKTLASTGNSSVASSTKKPTSTAPKTAPKVEFLVVKEWGLRFKIPSGLSDVKYIISGNELGFFAKPTGSKVEYRSDYANIPSDSSGNKYIQYAIGTLYRSKDSSKDEGYGAIAGKKLGNYYYYTGWSFSGLATGAACIDLYGDTNTDAGCQAEGVAFQLVNQGNTALLNTIELAP